ncbi:hypothetical protein IWQ61_000642 [Dispira simplex]|nr:hypothetical protein IWQ61_000642 [Dispira simplex]
MADSGASKKDAMYAQLAQSLHILDKNLVALRQNLETTQRQTIAIQQLTLSHASLTLGHQHPIFLRQTQPTTTSAS